MDYLSAKFYIMKYATLLIGSAFLFNSCIKHEVIPAPVPHADLKVHFKGLINFTDTEYTENVEGFAGYATKAKFTVPSPSPSSCTYYSEMKSTSGKAIKVGIGALEWDASVSSDPTTAQFDAFHNLNVTPTYATGTLAGFIVTYKDAGSLVWTSKGTPWHLDQNVTFSNLYQESDEDGHYSKFRVIFNTFVYRTYQLPPVAPAIVGLFTTDSLRIQNGTYDGWFQL